MPPFLPNPLYITYIFMAYTAWS